MAIESMKGSGVPYQGSQALPENSASVRPQMEDIQTEGSSVKMETDLLHQYGKDDEDVFEIQNQQTSNNSSIKKAVEDINKRANNSEAIFGIHDRTNRVTIKIIDKDSKKVLKEYPPEKTLDMIAKVWEMAGLMVDEKR